VSNTGVYRPYPPHYWLPPGTYTKLPSGVVGVPLPQPPNQQAAYRRDQYWSPRDYWTEPYNKVLASGIVGIPLPQPPLQQAALQSRRDQYWDKHQYWTRPPNSLPVGVTLAQLGAPPPPVFIEQQRRGYWDQSQYWTRPPNVLPVGVVGVPLPQPPNQEASRRRDQYWAPREYWTRPPNSLPVGATLAQPGFPFEPLGPEFRRDQYWSTRDYWTQPPVALALGATLAVPGATVYLDPAYLRVPWAGQQPPVYAPPPPAVQPPYIPPPFAASVPWRADQFQPFQAQLTPALIDTGLGVPLPQPPNQDAAQRRDQYWGLEQYWVQPPVALAVGATLAVLGAPPPPVTLEHRRDTYWGTHQYWTQPPTVLPFGVAPQIIQPPGLQDAAFRRDQYWGLNQYWTQPAIFFTPVFAFYPYTTPPPILPPPWSIASFQALQDGFSAIASLPPAPTPLGVPPAAPPQFNHYYEYWQSERYQALQDQFSATQAIIPPQPNPSLPDTHDSWTPDSHRWKDYFVWRERDLKKRLEELRGRSGKKAKRIARRVAEDLARLEAEARAQEEAIRAAAELEDENLIVDFLAEEEAKTAELLAAAAALLAKRKH
jgi:hypothetical protein